MLRDQSQEALELQPLQSDSSTPKTYVSEEGSDSLHGGISEQTYTPRNVSSWTDFLFPPELPDEVQLLRLENLAVPACYLMVGILQGMFRPLLNVYPIDLGATEAQQTTAASIATIPAAFKLVFGFLSDNYPIASYRRKPYMLLGWILASMTMVTLLLFTNLSLSYEHQIVDGVSINHAVPPKDAPSIPFLSVCFFLFGSGMWMADVMADSFVAQKTRFEPTAWQGKMQSTCYATRFFGLMVSAPIATFLYSAHGPKSIILILCTAPLLLLPLVYFLLEERNYPIKSTREQCAEIWKTICMRSVWQPMGFIFCFNILQLPNAAWRQFLVTVLHFNAAELNTLLVASYALLYVGTMTYKYCFLHASWRRLYQVCILLNGIFSAMQLLLIQSHAIAGFHTAKFLFALGDDAFAEFLNGIQFLPCAILMVTLCPPGSEGASYAMFTTVWNSAMLLAPAISSSLLLGIWDVSAETMQAGHVNGLFKLTLLTTLVQTFPIVFVRWLPHGRDDLLALGGGGGGGGKKANDVEIQQQDSNPQSQQWSSSAVGGGVFLFILFGSMFYTLLVAVLNVLFPGWIKQS